MRQFSLPCAVFSPRQSQLFRVVLPDTTPSASLVPHLPRRRRHGDGLYSRHARRNSTRKEISWSLGRLGRLGAAGGAGGGWHDALVVTRIGLDFEYTPRTWVWGWDQMPRSQAVPQSFSIGSSSSSSYSSSSGFPLGRMGLSLVLSSCLGGPSILQYSSCPLTSLGNGLALW